MVKCTLYSTCIHVKLQMLRPDEKPDVSYADIGGLDMQKQEVREAVELPLTHGELYKQVSFTMQFKLYRMMWKRSVTAN